MNWSHFMKMDLLFSKKGKFFAHAGSTSSQPRRLSLVVLKGVARSDELYLIMGVIKHQRLRWVVAVSTV